MVTVGALAALILVRLADTIGAPVPVDLPAPLVVLIAFAVPIVCTLVAFAATLRCARRLDRVGDHRAVEPARRIVFVCRLVIVLAHAGLVFGLGWPALVRGLIGDPPLVDELLAALPTLLGLLGTVAAWHPIDLRLREARIFAELERGGPVYPPPSMAQHLSRAVRLQLGTLLVPLCLLFAASESVELLGQLVAGPGGSTLPDWVRDPATLGWLVPVAQVVAAGVVLVFTPLVVRAVWDAPSLPAGDLRQRIESVLESHSVSVRDIVVWRTGGTVTNAAVIGLFPSLRYLALSDALLDQLSDDELEAITAHETAHLRRKHVPWLAASVLSSVLFIGGAAGAGLAVLGVVGDAGVLLASAVTIVAALAVLGAVSRRFEWQADAFAAAHLSGDADRVTDEGARTMSSALGRVAVLNQIDPSRFDWRHGSIRERRQRVHAIVGVDRRRLPQDRTVRGVLIAVVAVAPVGVLLVALESFLLRGV